MIVSSSIKKMFVFSSKFGTAYIYEADSYVIIYIYLYIIFLYLYIPGTPNNHL